MEKLQESINDEEDADMDEESKREVSEIPGNNEIRRIDSTYSSSLLQNNQGQLPLGDYISLLTSSLESLRRLEVTLPLLQLDINIDDFKLKIQEAKDAIEGKLLKI